MDLSEDPVPPMKVVTFLRGVGKNLIIYENSLPVIKSASISEIWLNYVQDIVVAR